MSRSEIKVTVIKRVDPEYIFDGNVPEAPNGEKYTKCTVFKEGQEFIFKTDNTRPEGFCPWAFENIFRDVSILMFGGDFYPWTRNGTQITCCNDGIRPVVFKLERIEKIFNR